MSRSLSPARRPTKLLAALAITVSMSLLLVGVASADNVQNSIEHVDPTGSNTFVAGGSLQVEFWINSTGGDGGPTGPGQNGNCNASDGTPVTISLSAAPAGLTISQPGAISQCKAGSQTNGQQATFSSTTPGTYTVTMSATDAGPGSYDFHPRNTLTIVVTEAVAVDNTPPVITPTITGTLGNNGWYTSDVSVSWTISDPESAATPATCPDTDITADTAGEEVSCSSTSAGGSTTETVTIKRDATPPTVTVNGVDAGPYTLGSEPTPTCDADDNLSGVIDGHDDTPTVTGGNANGVGTFTVTCAAPEDEAGNVGDESSATYSVIYDFDGFFAPVDNLPGKNTIKAGSAVPVKFSLNGDMGLAIFQPESLTVGSPSSRRVACDSTAGDPVSTVTAGQSSLSYDPVTDRYNYVWKTQKDWAGTCRILRITLNDGTQHEALFELKR